MPDAETHYLLVAVLQFAIVIMWWWADYWGVPKFEKIPTADLLLGVGLLGLGQVITQFGEISSVWNHCCAC